MQKWKYEVPEMKIFAVDTEVVTTSGDNDIEWPFGDQNSGSTQAVPAVEEMEI